VGAVVRSLGEEIRTDKDIDRAVALAFAGLVAFSFYSLLTVDGVLLRIEVAASMPLNALPAVFFWTRGPARESTRRGEVAVPALSVVLPFLAMNNATVLGAPYSFTFGLIVALFGAFLSTYSFLHLRRSFAIMPAVRKVVTSGPYGIIRHPLYLGELVYAAGMIMLAFNVLSVLLLILSVAVLILRINIEERKLRRYPEYQEYFEKVRYRMLPLLF
jgi:protein-S-isoprenylcysteine O-methyltransferase Ste14